MEAADQESASGLLVLSQLVFNTMSLRAKRSNLGRGRPQESHLRLPRPSSVGLRDDTA